MPAMVEVTRIHHLHDARDEVLLVAVGRSGSRRATV
jgi:hypothetical protein